MLCAWAFGSGPGSGMKRLLEPSQSEDEKEFKSAKCLKKSGKLFCPYCA